MDKKIVTNKMIDESVAMTRDFIREFIGRDAFKSWSAQQQKLLSLFLAKLKYDEGYNDIAIELSYQEIIEGLGWNYSKNSRNMKEKLQPDIRYMMGHCQMWLKGVHREVPDYAECLITGCKFNSRSMVMQINPRFMEHLENLFSLPRGRGWQFMIMPISDLQLFTSKYSQFFFMEFITCGKVGGPENTHQLSTKDIKRLLGMDETAYVRDNGKFDRYSFEKRVIIPAMQDIDKTEMVDIIKTKDGSYFEKYKKNGGVVGYKFRYRIYDIYQIYARRNHKHTPIDDGKIVEIVYDFANIPFDN